MVVAYHLIWTAYGWWLPNDPRGSSSHTIRSDVIANLGELHHGRKTIQPASADLREFYGIAAQMLRHELLTFTDEETHLIADSFEGVLGSRRYTCAIMPDHVHLLIRKHRDKAETMIEGLQDASRRKLIDAGRRSPEHPVWGGPGWKVFLETRADIERTMRYIRENPLKARRPAQAWEFVQPYDGWLPGIVRKFRPSD